MRTGLIAAVLGLTVVMIFVIQNAHAVNISFLGAHLRVSLAVALLLAAIAGALVMAAATPADHQPPVSQARHRAFARTIWCGVRQDTRMRSGLATMMARALAREVATFSRCGS